MEKIALINETEVAKMIEPTTRIVVPLLEHHRDKITSVPKRTFKYGATDRHQLDIYYPTTTSSRSKTNKSPILFFIYGGGFTTGDRTLPSSDLIHACVGSYFTGKGFITIIPDYRLIPNVTFPAPVEDIRDAIKWILSNPEQLSISTATTVPDLDRLFIMGHSAGAFITATLFLLPEMLASENFQTKISGIILVSGTYHFENVERGSEVFERSLKIWGSAEALGTNAPLALLEKASPTTLHALPETFIVAGEWEPERVWRSGDDFQKVLQSLTNRTTKKLTGSGHNHVSLIWGLGTGEGEAWAEQVVDWIWETSDSVP